MTKELTLKEKARDWHIVPPYEGCDGTKVEAAIFDDDGLMVADVADRETAEFIVEACANLQEDDEGEVTEEWFRDEFGDGDFEAWREEPNGDSDRVSVFVGKDGAVSARIQDNDRGPDAEAWAPMPHIKTRGQVRRLCSALGIPLKENQ